MIEAKGQQAHRVILARLVPAWKRVLASIVLSFEMRRIRRARRGIQSRLVVPSLPTNLEHLSPHSHSLLELFDLRLCSCCMRISVLRTQVTYSDMFNFKIVSLLGLASTAAAHFFLQLPETIGFDDSTMEEGPCGGFDPTLRDGPITDWPVNGHPVSLVTTHQSVVWHVEAALLSDPTNFVPIAVPFQQTGVGEVCFESVPGKASWVGEQVIISIYQVTNHGDLYQVRGSPPAPVTRNGNTDSLHPVHCRSLHRGTCSRRPWVLHQL